MIVKLYLKIEYISDLVMIIVTHSLYVHLDKQYDVEVICQLPDKLCDTHLYIAINVIANETLYKTNMYNILDNKCSFYTFINKYNVLYNHNIQLIPSYSVNDLEYYNTNPTKKNLYIKPIYGSGSRGIITGVFNIHNAILTYVNTHQIQDVVNIKCLYEINAYCINGVVQECVGIKTFNTRNWYEYVSLYILGEIIDVSRFKPIIQCVVSRLKYNGFVEFEFIEDDVSNIFLMECNPRISSFSKQPEIIDILLQKQLCIPKQEIIPNTIFKMRPI